MESKNCTYAISSAALSELLLEGIQGTEKPSVKLLFGTTSSTIESKIRDSGEVSEIRSMRVNIDLVLPVVASKQNRFDILMDKIKEVVDGLKIDAQLQGELILSKID
mmetsp:Transcript_4641/g.5247  ORF Transcript_4641/g.5247 Transcript_4641/m.5247 type:complete len:107 (-) Transcript_4641:758-1078(-)